MKVLIDSNVILEVILQREEYETANSVLRALYEGEHEMFMTTGCFYGMLYVVDKYLRKDMKLVNPKRTDTLRSVMAKVLSLMKVRDFCSSHFPMYLTTFPEEDSGARCSLYL